MRLVTPASAVVVFDGTCGMCTRVVEWLVSRDPDRRLEPVPCQSSARIEMLGVTRSECEASVWAVTPEGERTSGGEAAMVILAVLLQQGWPIVISRLPVLRQGLASGYRLIARSRHRFPGTTPWCQEYPEACDPARSA